MDAWELADDDDLADDAEEAEIGDFAYALNETHFVRLTRRGPKLLVIFESAPAKTDDLARHSCTLSELAGEMGWSVLALVSRGHTWFRDGEVIAFFDALVDGTLLDMFDDVLFYGTGSAGHAALGFSICAPLGRVLALAPHVRFDPEVRAWDSRFPQADRVDFEGRYPVDPSSLAAAEAVFAVYDPEVKEDAAQVGFLEGSSVVPLVGWRMGPNPEGLFQELGILDDVVSDAMEGELDQLGFYRLLRARRDNPAYLRGLVARLIEADRPLLEGLVVRNIAERLNKGRYARRLKQIEADLAASGLSLPPSRNSSG